METLVSLVARFESAIFWLNIVGFVFFVFTTYKLAREVRSNQAGLRVFGVLLAKSMPYYSLIVAFGFIFQLGTIALYLMAHAEQLVILGVLGLVLSLMHNFLVVPTVDRKFNGRRLFTGA